MRRRTVKQRIDDITFDLNLAPMLDMMVALVPFLLLSVVFIRLVVIEAPVPQPVAQAIENDKKKKDKSVRIQMRVNKNRDVSILVISKNNRKSTIRVKAKDQKVQLDTLHKKLVALKTKHQEVYSIELFPHEMVSYNEIIQVMDEARQAKKDEVSFEVVNKETKEKVKTKFMFPNITFGNVVEG